MTTQDWIDWAFAQQGLKRPEEKLALIALSLKANAEGGGTVTLGYSMDDASGDQIDFGLLRGNNKAP